MTPILAILHDSIRDLRARRMFWLALGITLLLVGVYASIGLRPDGVSLFFGLLPIENDLATDGPRGEAFLVFLFTDIVTSIWLAWGAVILALLSTAGVFPDFLARGSVDLVLSKPIPRTVVFLTKYVGCLLFVLAQVSVFCVGCLLTLGLRLGMWEPAIFLAVPLVVLVYSYLFSITALVGVLTRSGLTALTVTLIAWFMLFGLQGTEQAFNQIRVYHEEEAAAYARFADFSADLAERQADRGDEQRAAFHRERVETARAKAESATETAETMGTWHGRIRTAQWFLPRTQETISLVKRSIIRDRSRSWEALFIDDSPPPGGEPPGFEEPPADLDEGSDDIDVEVEAGAVEGRLLEYYWNQEFWKILGPSLGFEAVLLAIAAFVFVRRDF